MTTAELTPEQRIERLRNRITESADWGVADRYFIIADVSAALAELDRLRQERERP